MFWATSKPNSKLSSLKLWKAFRHECRKTAAYKLQTNRKAGRFNKTIMENLTLCAWTPEQWGDTHADIDLCEECPGSLINEYSTFYPKYFNPHLDTTAFQKSGRLRICATATTHPYSLTPRDRHPITALPHKRKRRMKFCASSLLQQPQTKTCSFTTFFTAFSTSKFIDHHPEPFLLTYWGIICATNGYREHGSIQDILNVAKGR